MIYLQNKTNTLLQHRINSLGTIVSFNKRYMLSDNNVKDMTIEEAFKISNDSNYVSYPIYISHTYKILLSTTSINLRDFDNENTFIGYMFGKIGIIYCSHKKLIENFGTKISKNLIKTTRSIFERELEMYANYINKNEPKKSA